MLPKIIKTVPHEIQLCFTLESPWYFLRMVCHVKVGKFSRLAGRFPIKCPKSNKMECQIWILKQCSKVLACNFFGQVHLQVLQLFVWNWWWQEGGMFLHFLTGPKILKTFNPIWCGALQVSTWPSSTKLATRSVVAVGEMCMKQFRIPNFKIRPLGAFEKITFSIFHPALPIKQLG